MKLDEDGVLARVLGTGSRVLVMFDLMEIADEEARRSGHAAAFLVVRPTDPLLDGASRDVYRSHCRELARRLARGEDCRPGTDAELLMVLSTTSMKAPLTSWATALMERLFARVLPLEAADLGDPVGREEWPGQLDEEEAVMRRKLTQEWRFPDGIAERTAT